MEVTIVEEVMEESAEIKAIEARMIKDNEKFTKTANEFVSYHKSLAAQYMAFRNEGESSKDVDIEIIGNGIKKVNQSAPKASVQPNPIGEATGKTIEGVGKKNKDVVNPKASVLPFGINVIGDNVNPITVTPEFKPQNNNGFTDPSINPVLVNNGPITMIHNPKVRMDTPTVVKHDPNINPIVNTQPDFSQFIPEGIINGPSKIDNHAAVEITATIINKYTQKGANIDINKVIELIAKNNLKFQLAEENGIIFVMVGGQNSTIFDQNISFAIDAGKNILNGKGKWFPCIMPVQGYGYEDYPIFELDCSETSTLSNYLKGIMSDNDRKIVGPEQLELNKYVDLVSSCYMDNTSRPAIMSRLKDAMKKGIFNMDKAGMHGTRYRISEVVNNQKFKLVNDAPYRYGFASTSTQQVEITFDENNRTHWKDI